MQSSNQNQTATFLGICTALILAFLVPIVFFPFVPNVFDLAKYSIVLLFGAVALIGFALHSFFQKSISVHRSFWTLGFALLGISTLLSIFLSSPNKSESLTATGIFLVALSVLYVVLATSIRRRFTSALVFAFAGAGVVITVTSVLEKVGVNFFSLLGFGGSTLTGIFPNGGALVNFSILLISLLSLLTLTLTTKKVTERIIAISCSGILVLGLMLNGISLLPGRSESPILLPFSASWSIALDVLKAPKTALVGVGPMEYPNAFSLFKPVRLNSTSTWSVRYGSGRNIVLDMIVTHGLVGVVALAIIFLGILSYIRLSYRDDLPLMVMVVTILILFMIIPANPVVWVMLVLALVAWQASVDSGVASEHQGEVLFTLVSAHRNTEKDAKHVTTGVIAGIGLVKIGFALFALYMTGSYLLAQATFAKGLAAVRANKAKEAYDLTRKAAVLAPYQEDVRKSFSSVNLLIAQGITQKKDISDEERKTAITLIQQSINEAKAAVALNPADSTNWVALAGVYDALIGSANQADQWTVAAYTQAIIRDPANPKLRVDLGGVFRKLKNDEQASRLFEQAAQLKPDYANAYFNMADVAKNLKRSEQELALLRKTLQLIKQDDQNYKKIQERIDVLAKEVDASKKKADSAKLPPKPVDAMPKDASESAKPKESTSSAKIELPKDAGIASGSAIPEVPKQ